MCVWFHLSKSWFMYRKKFNFKTIEKKMLIAHFVYSSDVLGTLHSINLNYYFRLLCMGALKNNGFERSKIIPQRQTKTNKHKIKQAIFKLQKFMLIGWIKLILVTLWHCNLFFIKAKQCVCVCTAK